MKASQTNLVAVQVRLPRDLAEFVESMAKAQFNTNGGIVRMAVAKLKEAEEQSKRQTSEQTAA